MKPALWGSRNDLLVDTALVREKTVDYIGDYVNGTAAIRHRFNDVFFVQGGIGIERGETRDVLGRIDYRLVGMPFGLTYDSTDSLLDPTQGFRVQARAAPYAQAIGSSIDLFESKVQASAYYAIDEAANYVLAGRIGFGLAVRPRTQRDPYDASLLRRRCRFGTRLRLSFARANRSLWPSDRRPEPFGRGRSRPVSKSPIRSAWSPSWIWATLSRRATRTSRSRYVSPPASAFATTPPSARSASTLRCRSNARVARRRSRSTSASDRRFEMTKQLKAFAAGLGVVSLAGLGALGVTFGMPDFAQKDKGFLAGLISQALSSPGMQVSVGAIDGALSSDATIRDVVIADKDGPWLMLDRARLVWTRTALLSRRLEVNRLEIGKLTIARKPVPSGSEQPASEAPLLPELPLKVEIDRFALQELVLGEPLLGQAARLSAEGKAKLGPPTEGLDLTFTTKRLDQPGTIDIKIGLVPKTQDLTVKVKAQEPRGGLIAHLAQLPTCRRSISTSTARARSMPSSRGSSSPPAPISAPTAMRP